MIPATGSTVTLDIATSKHFLPHEVEEKVDFNMSSDKHALVFNRSLSVEAPVDMKKPPVVLAGDVKDSLEGSAFGSESYSKFTDVSDTVNSTHPSCISQTALQMQTSNIYAGVDDSDSTLGIVDTKNLIALYASANHSCRKVRCKLQDESLWSKIARVKLNLENMLKTFKTLNGIKIC